MPGFRRFFPPAPKAATPTPAPQRPAPTPQTGGPPPPPDVPRTPTLDLFSRLMPGYAQPDLPWSIAAPQTSARIRGNDGTVTGSYTSTTGTGDDRESVSNSGSVTIDPEDGRYGLGLGWNTNSGTGEDATGHQGGVNAGFDTERNEISFGQTDITTEDGTRQDGTTYDISAGEQGFHVEGMDYVDGEGIGGELGYDRETGTGTIGGAYDNGRYSGGLSISASEHTTGIEANAGLKRGPGGVKVNGSYSVTTDEDFTQLIGDDAAGRYEMARDTIGSDLVSFGLKDAESWSLGASVDFKALSLSASYGQSQGTSVQFMQSIDALGLTDAELEDNEAIREATAEAMSGRLDGVEGPQDLDWVEGGVLTDALERGTGWSFDNFDQTDASVGAGLYGIGLTLGGTEHEYQELTIARSAEGEDKIVVDFTTMDRSGMNARLGMDGVATVGGEHTDTHSLNVQFELDPNDPGDLEALERMTSTGILPGAELALDADGRQEYETLYAEMNATSNVQDAAAARERLAELSEQANTSFLDDDDFRLGEVGAADYASRREELELEDRGNLSLLGFNAFEASVRETWWSEDYLEGDEQQRELGFEHEASDAHFLGWKTRDEENSFLSMNPRDNGNLALVGGSEWHLQREQAQRFIDMGLPGADAWRMQDFANDDLDRFTGVGRASMAMDDTMLDATMEYWNGHNMNIWDEVSEGMADDPMLDVIRGIDPGGYNDNQDFMRLDAQVRGIDFIDHSDPESRLREDPMTLLQEEAKRQAYRDNADQILEFANDRMQDAEYDDVDELMDALARGDLSDMDRMELLGMGGTGGTLLDGFAVNAYGERIEESVGAIIDVTSPEDFAGLSETSQEAWLATYTRTSDKNGWYALDMIQGAVEEETDDPDGMRDRLTRRLFREIERGTGDHDTATMEYIDFVGSLESWGGASADLAAELKTGIHVAVYDEGVLDRAEEAAGSLNRNSSGTTSFDPESDFAGDLDREVRHLFDNDFGENKGDADDLMDRLEGLSMAAGPDSAAVIDQWLAHATEASEFADTTAFVDQLVGQMSPNDEYYTKLMEILAQSSNGAPTMCVAP